MTSDTSETFLTRIVSDERLETEWINLLAQLEYVGCRKIVKAVPFDRVSGEILRHMQEEALHAQLLKQLAEKRGATPWAESAWSAIGWEYFQKVDGLVSALAPRESLRYPLVSWAIERRVLWLYPEYLRRTPDPEIARVLKTILGQEQRHAKQFDRDDLPEALREQAAAIEKREWENFVSRLIGDTIRPNSVQLGARQVAQPELVQLS